MKECVRDVPGAAFATCRQLAHQRRRRREHFLTRPRAIYNGPGVLHNGRARRDRISRALITQRTDGARNAAAK